MRLSVACVLLLLVPMPALAGWRIDRSKAIAAAVWKNPCGGHVALHWAITPPAAPADRLVWPTGEGAYAEPGRCTVTITSAFSSGWYGLCTTLLHEYGHLAAYRDATNLRDPVHSSNDRSVMHDNPAFPDPRCEDRGRPFLARVLGGLRPGGLLEKPVRGDPLKRPRA